MSTAVSGNSTSRRKYLWHNILRAQLALLWPRNGGKLAPNTTCPWILTLHTGRALSHEGALQVKCHYLDRTVLQPPVSSTGIPMFSWLRKKNVPQSTKPIKCADNPGQAAKCRVGIATGTRSWTEELDLVRLAA